MILRSLFTTQKKKMVVTKEMYDKELQAQYNQYRFIIAVNSRKWSLKLMTRLVRLAKGQKVKSAVNETHYVPSTTTKGHKIRTRVFRPQGSTKALPALLYLHGGGYMMGLPEMANVFFEDLLKRREVVIVAPDYRLSQRDPFPAGFNDSYDVLLWMRDRAEQLQIKPDNFIIAGHSAGGGMTAALTLKVRDTQAVNLAFQMPIYPMLDHRMITDTAKMRGSTMWDANINAFAWNLYLRNIKGPVPAYASPALNEDYRGFPPTISFVGDLEPFYDENLAYVAALKKAGVPVAFKVFKGGYHGFEVGSPDASLAREANQFQLDAFETFYDKYIP